ncbi:MAG: TetR/AcrR family transcriptional regulator [Coprobacillaceae bacterium]
MTSRVIKDPKVRKQEIIDTAMSLFSEKGYDSTSIADIARAMHVVPGLCYRYFSSKQEIFDAAVKQYAKESCQDFLEVIQETKMPIKERIHHLMMLMLNKEDKSKYHDFYHSTGNQTFHFQLSLEMLDFVAPFISNEFERLNMQGEMQIDDAEAMTKFILYGILSLWIDSSIELSKDQLQKKLEQIEQYIYKLLNIE